MRVRLTHSLGKSDFDLDYRGIDDPVVIGRATEADLQIPSITVGRSHAVFFVHDGNWVVQDSGTKEGTSRNGKKLTGPKILKKGDVLLFGEGDKAPRIDIVDLDAAVAAAPALVAVPAVAASGIAEPPFDAPGVAVVPAVPRPRAKKKSSAAMVSFMIIAGVVIAGGVGLGTWGVIRFKAKQKEIDAARNAKPKVVVTTIEPTQTESQRKTMFSESFGKPAAETPTAPATPVAPAAPVATPAVPLPAQPAPIIPLPVPTPVTPPAPIDNTGNAIIPDEPPKDGKPIDAEWARVLEFRDSSPPPIAIYQYLQYRTQNPQSPNLKKLDEFQAAAMDQLWWQRVNDLVEELKGFDIQIADLKKEKSELPSDAAKERREQFDRQIKDLQSRKAANRLLLESDMAYKSLTPVDTADEAALAAQRKLRDAETFERWSQRALGKIRNTRGVTAW